MPGPVTDARAYALREQYNRLFAGDELPVPVESIAEDLLGIQIEEAELKVSGLLLPAERRVRRVTMRRCTAEQRMSATGRQSAGAGGKRLRGGAADA